MTRTDRRYDTLPTPPDGFEVTWAGPNPWQPGICLGSDDGRLLFTGPDGMLVGPPLKVSPSEEAVNGVAAAGPFLAVTTRAEVSVTSLRQKDYFHQSVFHAGAHGVTATPGGHFVCPMGLMGWGIVDPTGGLDAAWIMSNDDRQLYIYRLVTLRAASGKDVVVCAARRAGYGATVLPGMDERCQLHTASMDGVDVVDVCGIGPPGSLAVAAVGRDGTLVLSGDVLHDRAPKRVRFRSIEGSVDRVMSRRGHLFVLTDQALYTFLHLARDFLRGNATSGTATSIWRLPVRAVDANPYGQRNLLVATDDNRVLNLDLVAIEESQPSDSAPVPRQPGEADRDTVFGYPSTFDEHLVTEDARPEWHDGHTLTASGV